MFRSIILLLGMTLGNMTAAAELDPASVYQLQASFSNQDAVEFRLLTRRGQVQLVAMFYTSCQYVCPLIVDSARGVEHALSDDERGRLGILLVSMDPEHDTSEKLLGVLQKRKLDPKRWTLARTDEGGVRKLAALLGVRYRKLANGEFNHSSALILLDAEGRVIARTEKLGPKPDAEFLKAVQAALK